MAIKARLNSIGTSSDGRERARRRLELEVPAMGSSEDSGTVLVHNLSETGLLIETTIGLASGDLIEVELPRAGARQAKVVWSSEHLFGCEFLEEVSSGTVSAAVLRAPFALSPVGIEAVSRDAEAELSQGTLSVRARLFTIVSLALLSWTIVAAITAWFVH
jgi:hypothetical protein